LSSRQHRLVVTRARVAPVVLTGIVTTNEVVVSPQIAAWSIVLVAEGDSVMVSSSRLSLTSCAPNAFYAHSADAATDQPGSRATPAAGAQTATDPSGRSRRAAAEAQRAEAVADADNAQRIFERAEALFKTGALNQQELDQKRTTATMTRARVAAIDKQVEAQHAALALARGNAEQNAIKRSQLAAMRAQSAAANAQRSKADLRLAYAEVHAPSKGVVNVRAVRPGEYVTPGQPLVSLVDPDDFWVRADVEESLIDRVGLGDTLTVRLLRRRDPVSSPFAASMPASPHSATSRVRDVNVRVPLRVDSTDRRPRSA
jgi:membrane fusion protein (multidrug efflux system)